MNNINQAIKTVTNVGNSSLCSSVTAIQIWPKSHTFTVILLAMFATQQRWHQKPWKGLHRNFYTNTGTLLCFPFGVINNVWSTWFTKHFIFHHSNNLLLGIILLFRRTCWSSLTVDVMDFSAQFAWWLHHIRNSLFKDRWPSKHKFVNIIY